LPPRCVERILERVLYLNKTTVYTSIKTNSLGKPECCGISGSGMSRLSEHRPMDTRRKELGEFLQIIRNRSQPADYGFPAGNRRRTKGLRREEIAQLIGISPTWYTWIEQGREVNVSAETLGRLAGTLRLTRSERTYLFEMAGRRDPEASLPEDDHPPPILLHLLSDITVPAYLMGRSWDILGWNPQAAELFAGWLDQSDPSLFPLPNMLRFVFLRPQTRDFLVDWDVRARRISAEFRADCSTRLEEPILMRLIDELSAGSTEFSHFWQQHDVMERHGGKRSFQHPVRGLVHYEQVTLRPGDHEHIKLVMLRPISAPVEAP